ncbi:MAG: cyclic nucleotide-binding domain-containing protein, partial [Mariprofundaceae bacterium]
EKASDFPNYPFGSWGPKAAFDLPQPGQRRWLARSPKQAIKRVPMFEGCGKAMHNDLAMMLKPRVFDAGDEIARYGSQGGELYIIDRGQVEIIDKNGKVKAELSDGKVFGELSLLVTKKRQATARALTYCAIYTLDKHDFGKVLKDRPQFAERIMAIARERYDVIVDTEELWAAASEPKNG